MGLSYSLKRVKLGGFKERTGFSDRIGAKIALAIITKRN